MPCYSPLTGYYGKEIGKSGKRRIVFSRDASFSGVAIRLPCGQCVGCRLERSRQWAIRCMHEKMMHPFNEFVTLTYDDAHLPEGNTLVKRHLQLFFKRLRKKFGKGVRFYACGEYGDVTKRPHYHALVFNLCVSDKVFHKRSRGGFNLYTSRTLEKIWGKGYVVVGDVTFDSAAYVARYIMKKVSGENAKNFYSWIDADGVVFDRLPEFTNMSRKPGIGLKWFEKYGEHAYKWDSVIMNGKEVRPPRYYDTKFEIIDPVSLEKLKVKRRKKALLSRKDNTPDRLRVRERVTEAMLKQKDRPL